MNIGYEGAEGSDRNKIHDMRNGIILRDGTVSNISGTDFYDFEGSLKSSSPNPLLDLNQSAINMVNVVSNISDNTMDNLMYGIYGFESANTIQGNEITLSTPTPGSGYTRGITLLRPQRAIIKGNEINEGMRGISIEDVSTGFEIEDNDLITSFSFGGISTRILIRNAKLDPDEGVILNNDLLIDDALASTGIHFINTNQLLVEENDVIFTNDGESQSRGILGVGAYRSKIRHNSTNRIEAYVLEGNNGIEMDNSGFNTLFCNDMDNFWINLNMLGPNVQTSIRSNTTNEGEYGFSIWSPTMLGTQKDHGNKWLATYGDYGAFLFGLNPEIEATFSSFIVDEAENGDFMPDPIGPVEVENGEWFKNSYTPVVYTPNCSYPPPPIANPDTMSKVILTALNYDQFNEEMAWIVKADMFDMILADPGLTSNAVLDSFYNAEENTPLGKLVAWQDDLTSRFGEERIYKRLALDTIADLSHDILYIDSILALSPNDSATWIALRVLKSDTLENEVAELKGYLNVEQEDSQEAYEAIADDLRNLSTTNDLEAYLQEALIFKTDYLIGTAYSSVDSTDIATLALLCPWEGGRAMSTGQELYATINNLMVYTTLDNCPAPPSRTLTSGLQITSESDNITIKPNPAADVAEIECSETILHLTLINTSMKSVYSSDPMDRQWSINLSGMPAGAYTLFATTPSGQYVKRIIHVE